MSPELPDEFLALSVWHDGFPHRLILEDTWHLLDSETMLEVYWEHQGLNGVTAAEPWRTDWLPLLSNGTGDSLLLNLSTLEVGSYFH
ncbi:hypothetical protein [Deinococcus sp. QL22]|uniref:hypothetical protein n=1 Tax=Deinococcus sp. QL22 TaxID=2939437 RepID=UPI002016C4BE|nr:hypothetical protein [Deinococcus sp. QL22]UQN10210.1 hypothetical protein M1R55_27935 [Deinococcus sp. QL22]